MAFVWSRLALAAVLAVGGATQAAASAPCGTPCGPCDEAPRLDCATAECPTIFADFGDPDRDPPLVAPVATALPTTPRSPADVGAAAPAMPTVEQDVLAVAPKTSPPRS